jgi:hypothetical protein
MPDDYVRPALRNTRFEGLAAEKAAAKAKAALNAKVPVGAKSANVSA